MSRNMYHGQYAAVWPHLCNYMWQLQHFNQLIQNIEDGWLLTVEDFLKHFCIKYQLSPQSSYCDAQSIILHSTVFFYCVPHIQEVTREGMTLVTPDLEYDQFAATIFSATTNF